MQPFIEQIWWWIYKMNTISFLSQKCRILQKAGWSMLISVTMIMCIHGDLGHHSNRPHTSDVGTLSRKRSFASIFCGRHMNNILGWIKFSNLWQAIWPNKSMEFQFFPFQNILHFGQCQRQFKLCHI
jgi:hypothetical protein